MKHETFSDVPELRKRVFYVLDQDPEVQAHRNSRAIGLLVEILHERQQLSDEQVEQLLSDVVDHA